MAFDPANLRSFDLDEEAIHLSGYTPADDHELRKLVGFDVRQRCMALRMSGVIMGMATAASADLTDSMIIESMRHVLERVHALRTLALRLIDVRPDHPDHAYAFNAVTGEMMSLVSREFRWGKLAPGEVRELPVGVTAHLMAYTMRLWPERLELDPIAPGSMALARRLFVVSATPVLHDLITYFDFFWKDHQALQERLLMSVLQAAESAVADWLIPDQPSFAQRDLFAELSRASLSLMAAVYRREANRLVGDLEAATGIDRSLHIMHLEHVGGLDIEGLLEAHREAMRRMLESASLIAASAEGDAGDEGDSSAHAAPDWTDQADM